MKITRKWVTLVLALAPGIYLASCGSGNRDRDNSDTLSTQSAPPPDVQSSTSDQRNMGDSSAISGRTGSTPGTEGTTNSGSTGTVDNKGTTNNSGLKGSTETTGTTTTEANEANKSTRSSGVTSTRKSSSKKYGTTSKRYSRSYGSKSRKAINRSETTQIKRSERDNTNVADTAAIRIRRLGDTTSTRVKRFGDTATKRFREFGDTASNRMRRFRDTTANRLDRIGDTTRSRISRMEDTLSNKIDRMDNDMDTSMRNNDMMGNEFDSTRGNKGNISGLRGRDRQGNFADTNDPENTDTSRNFSTQRSGMSFTPQRFISNQLESNYGEIKIARMAIDRSRNNEIKRIARSIENDHNTAIRELQSMARNSNISQDSIPTMEGRMGRQQMDMLQNSGGDEFDKLWVQHMLTMHEQKIQMFEQLQTNDQITDSNIKTWVTRTLPTLRKHRDELNRFSNRSPR